MNKQIEMCSTDKLRKCAKCKNQFPANAENFYRNRTYKDGLDYLCKGCKKRTTKLRNSKKFYKPLKTGEKLCKKCNCSKSVKEFSPDKNVKSGLSSYCKQCWKTVRKEFVERNYDRIKKQNSVYDPTKITRRESHPKEWYQYLNSYMKEYRKDPVVKKKMMLAGKVNHYKKLGKLVQPTHCQVCGKEDLNLKATFSEDYINDLVQTGRRVYIDEFINSITWKCKECVYKERNEKNKK